MEAFIYLDSPESSPWRRKDGDTILHSAISGEYFGLAYHSIEDYPKLVNSVNEEGFSPLHVLARKPNMFKSSNNFRLFDQLIYRWVVDELKKQTSPSPASKLISPCCRYGAFYPDNYDTCVNLFSLPWAALRVIVHLGKDSGSGGPSSCSADEENPTDRDGQLKGEESKKKSLFPPNYATGIRLLNFLMSILLTILVIGMWRISKIKQKKERHRWAVEVMTELIYKESCYNYAHSGRRPTQELEPIYAERPAIPHMPPSDDNAGTIVSGKVEKDTANHLTALLLAAKNGITEMVEEILETFPVAIQDLDENEKNALLLVVENRQMKVNDLLLEMKLPECFLSSG